MTYMPQTQEALYELRANTRFGGGHVSGEVLTGSALGRQLADIPFNPVQHSPNEINHFSPLGIALGEDYVRKVQPSRALRVSVVLDRIAKNEHPLVTQAKQTLAYELVENLDETLPHHKDRLRVFTVGEEPDQDSALAAWADSLTTDDDPRVIESEIAELCSTGHTFVVSDFERFQFGSDFKGRVNSLIAVKVNHPLERVLPAGVGYVSLGGGEEVNTNRRKKLEEANRRLAQHHEDIVGNLHAAGARLVDVVLDFAMPRRYDGEAVDRTVATAIIE